MKRRGGRDSARPPPPSATECRSDRSAGGCFSRRLKLPTTAPSHWFRFAADPKRRHRPDRHAPNLQDRSVQGALVKHAVPTPAPAVPNPAIAESLLTRHPGRGAESEASGVARTAETA